MKILSKFPQKSFIGLSIKDVIHFGDIIIMSCDLEGTINLLPLQAYWREDDATNKQLFYLDDFKKLRQKIFNYLKKNEVSGDSMISEFNKLYDLIRFQLLEDGYIKGEFLTSKQSYSLTEKGQLTKELEGQKNYIKHRKNEINANRNQTWINIGLIVVALIAAVMPFVVALHQFIKQIIKEK
jgi:hypothetical protein